MQHSTNRWATSLFLLSLLGVIAAAGRRTSMAAHSATPVLVTNAILQPEPSEIINIPDIKAAQNGVWSVKVNNTAAQALPVSIWNTASVTPRNQSSAPLFTEDAGLASINQYSVQGHATLSGVAASASFGVVIPAGKTLVVRQVNAFSGWNHSPKAQAKRPVQPNTLGQLHQPGKSSLCWPADGGNTALVTVYWVNASSTTTIDVELSGF